MNALDLQSYLNFPDCVITANIKDAKVLAGITADAFWNDPVNAWIFQSFKGMRATFEVLAKDVYLPRGMCHMIPGKAAAMWMLPEVSTAPSTPALFSIGANAIRHGGPGALGRVLAFDAAAVKAHPKTPHLYLFTVGVRPEFKGKGYGKTILLPVLQASGALGLPIYLENSKPENHGFYAGLGFKRQEIFRPKPGAPPLEAMLREPKRNIF